MKAEREARRAVRKAEREVAWQEALARNEWACRSCCGTGGAGMCTICKGTGNLNYDGRMTMSRTAGKVAELEGRIAELERRAEGDAEVSSRVREDG